MNQRTDLALSFSREHRRLLGMIHDHVSGKTVPGEAGWSPDALLALVDASGIAEDVEVLTAVLAEEVFPGTPAPERPAGNGATPERWWRDMVDALPAEDRAVWSLAVFCQVRVALRMELRETRHGMGP